MSASHLITTTVNHYYKDLTIPCGILSGYGSQSGHAITKDLTVTDIRPNKDSLLFNNYTIIQYLFDLQTLIHQKEEITARGGLSSNWFPILVINSRQRICQGAMRNIAIAAEAFEKECTALHGKYRVDKQGEGHIYTSEEMEKISDMVYHLLAKTVTTEEKECLRQFVKEKKVQSSVEEISKYVKTLLR